jgi:hypothetical protein
MPNVEDRIKHLISILPALYIIIARRFVLRYCTPNKYERLGVVIMLIGIPVYLTKAKGVDLIMNYELRMLNRIF